MRFKTLRIAILLLILAGVVHHQASDRARFTSWETPVFVTVFPVNADGSERAARYIDSLRGTHFDPLVGFLEREARRYGLSLERPMYIELGRPVDELPPDPPMDGGFVARAWWGLKLRWWRWRFDDQGTNPDIIVLARYFDPDDHRQLPHSTGVERIRVAIANLFATRAMRGENRVVLMHEVLHTIGATDKYDLGTGQPLYPHGYAEPQRRPLLPQRLAEIMAGRIPVAENEARQAESLARVIVGPATASELGWAEPGD
jgi:hypothetical protein